MHTSPNGFTTLFPYLFINEAKTYIDFLVRGLGGVESNRTLGPSEQIANSQIRFGDTTMMISEAEDRYPAAQASFYLYVEDADAVMAQAIAEGAELEMAAADMDYGDRQGGVRDPRGNIWWISQRISES